MGESDTSVSIDRAQQSTVTIIGARILQATPTSFKMREWPNEFGDNPDDAIGKIVRVEQHDMSANFVVTAVDDENRLLLEPHDEVTT